MHYIPLMNPLESQKYLNYKPLDLCFPKRHPLLHLNHLFHVPPVTVLLHYAYLRLALDEARYAPDYVRVRLQLQHQPCLCQLIRQTVRVLRVDHLDHRDLFSFYK